MLNYFVIAICVQCEFKAKQLATKEPATKQLLYELVKEASLHFNFRYGPGNITKIKWNSIECVIAITL